MGVRVNLLPGAKNDSPMLACARPMSALNGFLKDVEDTAQKFLRRGGVHVGGHNMMRGRQYLDARDDHNAARLLLGSYNAGVVIEAVMLAEYEDVMLYSAYPHIYPDWHPDLMLVYFGWAHEEFAEMFAGFGVLSKPHCFINEL